MACTDVLASAACMRWQREHSPPSPLTMSLDASGLQRLVLGCLLWELLFRAFSAAAGRGAPEQQRFFWKTAVPSYAVSTVHALFMSWRGAGHLWALWAAPEAEKHVIVPGAAFYAANEQVELSNFLFLCYMCYDVVHVLAVFPRLGGADTAAHHCGFALAALLAGTSRAFPFCFGWLVLCEASTPLLNLRWFVKARTKQGAGAGLERWARRLGFASLPRAEAALDATFALVFLLTRALGYGAGVAHLLRALAAGRYQAVPPAPVAAMTCVILLGFVLNLSWMRRLMMAAGRKAK